MKIFRSVCLGVLLIASVVADPGGVRAKDRRADYRVHSPTGKLVNMDHALERAGPLRAAAANDTTWLYEYSFDTSLWLPIDEGWTSHDATEQADTFFHVAGMAELNGGSFGGLVPLEGSQSVWCGISPGPEYCSYATLPGYGDRWRQSFVSRFFEGGLIQLVYKIRWDTEPLYDFVYTQYDEGDGNWVDLPVNMGVGRYDGTGTTVESMFIMPATDTRFRFLFTSDGAWSDQDGKYDGDGAALIDSIRVLDLYGLHYEDFEDEAPGDRHTQDWSADVQAGYGDHADLFIGYYLLQNQCNLSLDNAWGFFSGSTYTYDLGCGGNGAQLAVPYGNSSGQYIANEIWSPVIPFDGTGSSVILESDVYKDLPLDNLVFYKWSVRSFVGGCTGKWTNDLRYDWGDEKDWVRQTLEIGPFIDPGADSIQVAMGVYDMVEYWGGTYGTGACHTHAPLVDDVRIVRVADVGPRWVVRDVDLFQDNFPTNGTIVGTGRADVADNQIPPGTPGIVPVDEAEVWCTSPGVELMLDPFSGFGPAVYCYVSVLPTGQPGKDGGAIEGDAFRWPFVGSAAGAGLTWYRFRMDTVFSAPPGVRQAPEVDRYCVDLNDDLFTPGDTILFFYGARDATGNATYWSEFTGAKSDIDEVAGQSMEFQILPGGGWFRGGNILYVDDFDGRGAEPYFETAFEDMGIADLVDRYDVRDPTAFVGNGLGGRVLNTAAQLASCYDVIIWNSGDLSAGTIGDGTGAIGGPGPEKSDDFAVLYDFLDQHTGNPGLYISGDDVAQEWVTLTGPGAVALRARYMNFNLTNGDHRDEGFPVSPVVTGDAGTIFFGMFPDTVVAYGGCAALNDFDVLEPTGPATLEATYEGSLDATHGAVIAQDTLNAPFTVARVVLSGYSYHFIRDDRPFRPIDRSDHLYDILTYLNQIVPPPVKPDPTGRWANRLYQNYRNPFNPTTTIRYTIAERTRVTLCIYNVAGQLVKTLVDEEQSPAEVHSVGWDGRDNRGQAVASGVYFYKLATSNFSDTKKMILLK